MFREIFWRNNGYDRNKKSYLLLGQLLDGRHMYLYQFQDDEYNSLKQNLDSDLPQSVEQRSTYSHLENWTGELLGMLLPQALLNLIIAQESSLCEIFVRLFWMSLL